MNEKIMINEIKKVMAKMEKYNGKYILGFKSGENSGSNIMINYVIGEREFIGELADKLNIGSIYGEI